MRVDAPIFWKKLNKGVQRTALVAGIATPIGIGLAACGNEFQPSAQISSARGEQVEGKFSTDTKSYPYRTVVQTGPYIGVDSHHENAVEFFTSSKPVIDKSGTVPQITLNGIVFCPEDQSGQSAGCTKNDTFFNGVKFTLIKGGINIIDRYDSPNETKKLSREEDSYSYRIAVQIEITGEKDVVDIYSNDQPTQEQVGSVPVITISHAYCPTGGTHGDQVGCGSGDKFVESITLIGGWGSTFIIKQR